MNKDDMLSALNKIKEEDEDKSLFYSWNLIPEEIQKDFISWCMTYMEADHGPCFGGWESGWSKYYQPYIDFLKT